MKKLLSVAALLVALSSGALAVAPHPLTELNKTLRVASRDQKFAFVLLGRSTCGICNATKEMIKEGKINVTAADYVLGDLNADDERVAEAFLRKYDTADFGDILPFVVITDSHGKMLASSGGAKDAAQWNALLAAAKKVAARSAAAANGPAKAAAKP